MQIEDLERNLEKGNTFGFQKKTDDREYLGWIALWKAQIHTKGIEILTEEDDPIFFKEHRLNKTYSYLIRICEMKESVCESEAYPSISDYKLNKIQRFKSLSEVNSFLMDYGFELKNILWYSDIKGD